MRFQTDPFCIAYFKHLRFPIVFIVLGPGYRDAFSLKAQQYCYVFTLPLSFHNMNTEQFENVSMQVEPQCEPKVKTPPIYKETIKTIMKTQIIEYAIQCGSIWKGNDMNTERSENVSV